MEDKYIDTLNIWNIIKKDSVFIRLDGSYKVDSLYSFVLYFEFLTRHSDFDYICDVVDKFGYNIIRYKFGKFLGESYEICDPNNLIKFRNGMPYNELYIYCEIKYKNKLDI